jgi:2-C-methyl-D-erythritol 2,4-cyclodiphosphate synthase
MARIGTGYDIHRVAPGGPLTLGGVQIDCPFHLLGHSDADAVLHAVTDAVLGALAAGDIGDLFPDTDPKYAGADSAAFLAGAMALAGQANYRVENCDVTIVAERPKLSAYKRAMQERIASLLGVAPSAVGVKAKTNEGLGPVGAGEAVAVMAAVLLAPA